MARALLRVKRSESVEFFGGDRMRYQPRMILTDKIDQDSQNYIKHGEFFEIEEVDIEAAIMSFARENPGCEVFVYLMTHSGVCPPGDLVMKTVSKDGVLPA